MKAASWLGAVIVALAVVTAAPTLVRLAGAVVPLIVALGIVAAVLRIVWFYTH